jgi:hypothetical protein
LGRNFPARNIIKLLKFLFCMLDKNFIGALHKVAEKLNSQKIKWALVGSANLAIQGMDVKPKDLDIVVQLKDLKKVGGIFSQYNVSDIKELGGLAGRRAFEVKFNIEDVEIQVLGEENSGVYASKMLDGKIRKISVDDFLVRCLNLEAEARAYEETNRENKAKMIRKFLDVC